LQQSQQAQVVAVEVVKSEAPLGRLKTMQVPQAVQVETGGSSETFMWETNLQ
jgi:hypothetical protein